ncbi:UdgX family uracil-DNA binding protein [Stieleria sp. JC731]|uniref:UdgX family uracil-DNA binding protein n=1 Tax=Pirellulaceae TaxID=2691357 RepID=UPI001E366325|nr:UdgX family uracil-DNA binding protein [Stieleria sp. JC731]MCC9599643.1 UdgX family uracil-DNA binding protein [Stieleria sp. JC731]
MHSVTATTFDDWRLSARTFLQAEIEPSAIRWIDHRSLATQAQQDLFGTSVPLSPALPLPADLANSNRTINVPASFLSIAKTVSFHRSPSRWENLYGILWRLSHGEKHLLSIASDPDVIELAAMEKAVRRDAHKTKAFVRFRSFRDNDGERFVAWHRPDHYVLRYVADFFCRRFDVMRWSILTPDESCHWDGAKLTFSEGLPRSSAPADDEIEELWKTYYANIFNPARIKLKAMQAEMPKKHWATMPETELIEPMLRDAPRRVEQMIQYTDSIASAQSFVPQQKDIAILREAAATCQGCALCHDATQTVFGSGPENSRAVLVGEQPGDNEDQMGQPFVGPAGKLLREVLHASGIDEQTIYMTNAVKHFKFTRSGKRRLHKKPSAREVAACRPWLQAELETIRPKLILCLGASASGVIFGPNFRITEQRGQWYSSPYADRTLATYHPSALLRAPQDKAAEMRREFESDIGEFAKAFHAL